MARYTQVKIQLIAGLHKCETVKFAGVVIGWMVYVRNGLYGQPTFVGYIWKDEPI